MVAIVLYAISASILAHYNIRTDILSLSNHLHLKEILLHGTFFEGSGSDDDIRWYIATPRRSPIGQSSN